MKSTDCTLDGLARILTTCLSAAIAAINSAIEKETKKRPGFLEFGEGVRKSKYMFVKSAIDDAVPTMSPFQAAEGLRSVLRDSPATRSAIFLNNIALEKQPIPHSSVQRAVFRGDRSDKDRSFFVESIICLPGADLNALTGNTRKLARRLTAADPLAFGLLNCKGVIKVPGDVKTGQSPSFTMVYRPPEDFKPEDSCSSLREFLLINTRKPSGASLSRRIAVAQSLARSVSSIHTFEFVHKNIRPESVLLLGDMDDADAGATFLLGFDSFREADGATYLLGDVSWDRNLYRHPTRHGNFITERYRMHHDVYSLGVCLLELGLGESFVAYDADQLPIPASRLVEDFGTWLKTTEREAGEVTGRFEESAGVLKHSKDYLEHLAATQLPQSAGTRYTQAVMACLSCLDDDKSQVEEDDPYGIEVGMGFIQNILGQLDEILV